MTDAAALEALGIDPAEGLAYCADDPEFYEEMLAEYLNEGGDGLNGLSQDHEAQNWGGYRIRVHSLKNTSRMIGAAGLSERSFALETAAKEGRLAEMGAEHAAFLAEYRALLDGLRRLLG